jgi:hypothetical protein
MEDPVVNQLLAYNARDVDKFITYFSDDVIVEDGMGAILISGKTKLYDKYKIMFASFPHLHCEVVKSMRVGVFAIDEEMISGREDIPIHCIVMYRVSTDNLIELIRILK